MKNASFVWSMFYSIWKSKSLLFSLITNRSDQRMYTILHNFLRPANYSAVLTSSANSTSTANLSHQQSGVEPQLQQPDTNLYSSLWFSESLVLAISERAENHLLWPIVALIDQEPAFRYLENGRFFSNKIHYISVFFTLKMITHQDSLSYFMFLLNTPVSSNWFVFLHNSSQFFTKSRALALPRASPQSDRVVWSW